MNKVVTIHLDGIAYQLEESAYGALQAYLDDAKQKLANNPDKDEIVADLEQAIGAKLNAHLSNNKNVLTQSDIDEVLAEMGPVAAEGDTAEPGASADADKNSGWNWPGNKRLYRVSEGRWIAGVCTGLAAYFNVDVMLVRVLFIITALFFHGLGGLVYIIMMIFVPRARTPKDYENVSGMPPVTAQELVDRARKSVEDFANSNEWKHWSTSWKNGMQSGHDAHLAWKHQRKAWKRAQKQQWKAERYVYQYGRPKTFLSELNEFIWSMFGLAIMLFAVWFLYHHVPLVEQFINFVHHAWDSFFSSLAQAMDHGR